ncbi:MAG TPA: UDP-3-O-(3-hydroxymyristoyl)glucosamine N-acyltransferase [Acidiphilium sp.]|nr:MAG: UDP-3-O-(3-hydroxymyristoyl)glucosamine N-acyltransferase [Acidiphilium sp. 21-60-14]OYV89640.1 MAG: UDP-3-O-(3-hydroxymyristoyl)glucosamine N-acyltransferase [Acidiphilium sp. 37-60-79]HQT88535.1 UDP-3-O-(3-hydroxymyristoyl)glucosamine N-acyltransferase [Acidiphilium sp.]HQU23813.1 UDP-3-O-(3-hydroxymyristoyl)glucosamine N-acyltransferase [Acidiphilium sp.]
MDAKAAPNPITTIAAPDFHPRRGPFTLAVIGETLGIAVPDRLLGLPIDDVAALDRAGPDQISFLDNRRYRSALSQTSAAAVILAAENLPHCPPNAVPLVTSEPYLAWARVCALFHPRSLAHPGIHPSAIIDPSALVDPSAEIGPLAIIGAGAKIGAHTIIGPQVSIGAHCVIGSDCHIGAQVSIAYAILGDRITIHPGARIGQDGFGFAVGANGFTLVPQLGCVRIDHDVSIGANTTIDRGSAQDTIIGAGTRIDNQVQIAHNVRIGRYCVICAQAGISGSSSLGDRVTIAGQAGFVGHIHVGSGARIGGQAGIMADVPAGAEYVGSPAQPARDFFRGVALLRQLARRSNTRG